MSRGKKRSPRKPVLDPVYQSVFVSKLINMLMYDGKAEVAEKIVYEAIKKSKDKLIEKFQTIPNAIESIILIIGPTIKTQTKRIGGSNYQIPRPVPEYRRISMGIKMLIKAARKKSGRSMAEKLSSELLLATEEKGEAVKERINIVKMASANKAFAHLA